MCGQFSSRAATGVVVLLILGFILLPSAGTGAQASPGDVRLCSCNNAGLQGNKSSWISCITDDGNYVAFQTSATNLVPGATQAQICRKFLPGGEVKLCSCNSSGTMGNASSNSPAFAAGGRYVFFVSTSSNLGPGGNGNKQVFRKDLTTNEVKLCSCSSSGTLGNGDSGPPSPSADGRYVAFDSYATNLMTNPTSQIQVFLKDLDTGIVLLCSTNASGVAGDSTSATPKLTPDARYVAFRSIATNLGYGAGTHWQDYRKDLDNGSIVLVSCNQAGTKGDLDSYATDITGDGRYVAIDSNSTNLVPGSSNDQIYRKDLQTGEIALVSCDASGNPGNLNSVGASISDDGRSVAFDSFSYNLVPGSDTHLQVYRKDLETGDIIVVSSDAAGNSGNDRSESPAMTPDAKYVTFSSLANNLIAGTANEQVFRKELAAPVNAFYFAEGYTGAGFQEYLCLGNPATADIQVDVIYLFPDGTSTDKSYIVPADSRFTADVNSEVGADKEVSIKCSTVSSFVAERPMYFDYIGGGADWTGGSDAVGATSTSSAWYFAEGYTGPGFDEWVCVLNPGNAQADLTFHFQTQEEGEKTVPGHSVAPHSRASFKANDLLGGKTYQTSLRLESSRPVVAERPMYFDYQGTQGWGWTGGHCVMGATGLAERYYFPEGTTRGGFEEWLCLQNPGTATVQIDAYYLTAEGDEIAKVYDVEAGKRRTVFVPDEVGPDRDTSVYVSSGDRFLAERPMYFDYQGLGSWGWTGGHCVIGATAASQEWFFAEGYTGENFEEWLCLQNTYDTPTPVTVTYYPEGGAAPIVTHHTVPANARYTIPVNADAGPGLSLSAEVSADKPIICERPMYFNFQGKWDGGSDVVGYRP